MTFFVESISFYFILLYIAIGDEMEDSNLKHLIVENQNFIYSIAKKFKGDIEDLFQVGCIGFINAYKNYDIQFQTKFTTYAYSYVFGEIYKYVIQNKNIRVSPDIIKLNTALNKAHDYLSQKFKREPTDLELATFLEIPVYKVAEVKNSMEVVSLDDNRSIDLYNIISFENISKDDWLLLKDAILKLDEKEKELILKRYFYNMTQSEIAKQYGINQVKVSREEGKVLTKLRSYM